MDPLLDVRSGCCHAGTPSTMSTSPGLPLTLDCCRQVPDVDARSRNCVKCIKCVIQFNCTVGYMYTAPTVPLVAYIKAIVNFMSPTVLLDKYVILLGSTVLLNTHVVSCSL